MNTTKYFVLIFLTLLTWFPAKAAEDNTQTLYLRVGQRYPIEGIIGQAAKITPESVASAHRTPEGILLVGHQAGQAVLSLETNGQTLNIKVVVRPHSLQSPQVPSHPDLKTLPGVRFTTLGGKTLIQGEILGRKAYQEVLFYLKHTPSNLVMTATPGPGIKESLVEQALSLLKARSLLDVQVSHAGNRFFLEGHVTTPEDVDQAFEIAQGVLPNIENHLAVPIRVDPTISVRVFILELSRQAHLALGLSWPGSTKQAIAASTGFFGFAPTWTANLQHLSASGHAKVLAEPVLAVKNGSTAELSAGGEIPIRITGRYENKVAWKNYGLRVHIQIGGIAGKHIRTKIETESSQLDEATAVDGVPGIRTNKMSTEVDVIESQPILLTGLFQSSAAKDIEKVPILGDIPLLGELFKSRRFREHESELLVALLPTFGAQTIRLPLESTHGLNFDFRWRILD